MVVDEDEERPRRRGALSPWAVHSKNHAGQVARGLEKMDLVWVTPAHGWWVVCGSGRFIRVCYGPDKEVAEKKIGRTVVWSRKATKDDLSFFRKA